MKFRTILALLVAALGVVWLAPSALATNPVVVLKDTVHVLNNEDTGHYGAWAMLDYDRSVTFTSTGDVDGKHHYTVLLTDDGKFTTVVGARSPRQGKPTLKQTGTFHGQYSFTVITTGTPSKTGVKTSYDFKCDGKTGDRTKDCPGMPSSTSNWPRLYLGGDQAATVTGGPYRWTYTTCVETWVDASDNSDGADAKAGDVTGKACPSASPTPSATTPAATSSPVTSESPVAANASLPKTGGNLRWLMVGTAALLLGGVTLSVVARRRRAG